MGSTPDRWLPLFVLASGLFACVASPRAVLPEDDAGRAAPADAGPTPAADAGPTPVPDGGLCSTDGALAIAGDYVAPDGTEHWLRKSPTAATYTVVPGAAPDASVPPQLSRIKLVCPSWLLLESTDGTFGRLDWVTADGALSICVRAASSASDAADLPSPGNCSGSGWIALTEGGL